MTPDPVEVGQLRAALAADPASEWSTGYEDPIDDRLARMLLNGWRYEDDCYDPQRLRVMIEAAGLTSST